MMIQRIVKHLLATEGQVRRALPRSTLNTIEKAIKASETAHVGEIRFAVEGALDGLPLFKGQSARERAIELFSPRSVFASLSEERCKSAVPDVIKRKLTIKAFHTLADALWTIEVADSSVGYDRLIKVPLYAKNRIAEF